MEIELEEFKDEVYRKIGRNIMLLQKIEMLLKYLLSHRNIEGYSKELKMIAENKLEFYQNQTMGMLLKEFFKENTLSNQDKTDKTLESGKGVWVSFNIVFGEKNSEFRKKEQESLDLLKTNRNSLVHNSLPNWDYLNSIEGCELACRELDYQYDDHIKPVFHSLNVYTEILQEKFKEGIKEELNQYFLINSSLVKLLSEIAGQTVLPDGWISLDVAISMIKKQSPEELNSLEQKFGFKKLKDLMIATNLFEFSDESTKKGDRRILYRNISS